MQDTHKFEKTIQTEFAPSNCQTQNNSDSENGISKYDPFAHRHVNKPTSDTGAFAHLLKSSLGSGILAMPRAFRNGGLFFGLIGTLIVGFICTHCVQILVDSSHVLCRRTKKPLMTFPETAQYAFESGPKSLRKFAKAARISTESMIVVTYLMAIAVYVVLIATTIQKILGSYDTIINIRLLILALWVPVLLLCTIRPLKWLVPFSIIANICIAIVFGITMFYVFNEIRDPAELPAVANYANIPLFFTTVICSMEGIGVIMPLENQMKTPQHFTGCPGILNIGMFIVVVLYAVIGFFGYLRFGNETQATITINLLETYPDDIPAQLVQYLIALAIFFTYALQFYVPTSIIWSGIKHHIDKSRRNMFHYILRFILITGTIILAIAVPQLGPIIDLVGAVCFSILGLLLPAVIDTVTRIEIPDGFGKLKWKLWKNLVIMILALLALIVGTYTCILEIIDAY